MKKKNCPALYRSGVCCDAVLTFCEEKTDCLIKQIIDKCRRVACSGIDCDTCLNAECNHRLNDFAKEIIQEFDVEEVNDAG